MAEQNAPQTPQPSPETQPPMQQLPQQPYQPVGQAPQQPVQFAGQAPMQQPAQAPAQQALPKSTSGMGIASLVLGILAFLASFIPLLNILSFPLVILGLLFAVIGLVGIKKGKHVGKGITMAGLVLCLLALVITVVMYVAAAAVSDGASSSGSSDGATSSSSAVTQDASDTEAGSESSDAANQAEPAEADQEQEATSSGKTYESVYDDYAAQLQEAGPRLVDEYYAEAAGLSDIQAKAELCSQKIEELAQIDADGTEEMAQVMWTTGGDYSEYEDWSMKLYSVYEEQAGEITNAYMATAL
ncbi:MAG: DUF4190 domain-containing protein [Eggerthellaceae bacterium]|nr:DUF4190 domain-containing protein [Eggerthellaceae bacterium]